MRATLTRLGLSQTSGASLVGVNARTMRRYIEPTGAPGHLDAPRPVWLLLDLIEHVPGVRERLAAHAPPGKPSAVKHPTLPVSMILPSDKLGQHMAIWRGVWLGTYGSAEEADAALNGIDALP